MFTNTGLPTITTVTVTLNSQRTLDRCLNSIFTQDYPKELLKVLVVDGGSKDKTIQIAQSYDVQLEYEDTKSPEGAKSVALEYVQSELVCFLPSDNILPNVSWLRQMVEPFRDPTIYAAQPWRYAYERSDTALNRYFSLMGVNDPVPFYLKVRDRLTWYETSWALGGKVSDETSYLRIQFTPDDLPTVGDNGFIIRTQVLKQSLWDRSHFFHIDVNLDLVRKGHTIIAMVKNDILHASGEEFWGYFLRRRKYLRQFLAQQHNRRYSVVKTNNLFLLFRYVLFSITFVEPLYRSLQGYRRLPDVAWFLHPLICVLCTFIYGYTVVEHYYSKRQR